MEPTGERVGYLRLFGGTLAARRRVTLYRRDADGGTRARPVRLTRGEGFWASRPEGLRPVGGEPPRRERTDGNPLVREEYLIHLGREGGGRAAP